MARAAIVHRPVIWALALVIVNGMLGADAGAQRSGAEPAAPASAAGAAETDALGRDTPRSALLGLLNAGRRRDFGRARHYLNTALPPADAEDLSRQLFVVLDQRLPPRLLEISDVPEGSRANPLAPLEEVAGAIEGPDGPVDIVLERIARRNEPPVWLFSRRTLEAIPAVYDHLIATDGIIARMLAKQSPARARVIRWLIVLVGLPLFYFLTVLLNRALRPVTIWIGRKVFAPVSPARDAVPAPARLLLLSVAGHWLVTSLPLSFLARQRLAMVATVAGIGALTWLVLVLNGEVERHFVHRIPPSNASVSFSLLRIGRRVVDAVLVLIGGLAILQQLGVNPTPLLAGLGVGGIAVALAAQKTLENVIAGASLIFDQAVRVGDFLRVGTVEGTVDHIGLRSTRIRTMERTIVSVPNSQIANMSLETLSARDKFWFHPVVGLRYETTADQLRAVLDGIRTLLAGHPSVDRDSIRVRLLRLAAFSMDVEVFAYVHTANWPAFLEIQESLLIGITGVVEQAGTGIAFPSQTMYLSGVNAQLPSPNSQLTPNTQLPKRPSEELKF